MSLFVPAPHRPPTITHPLSISIDLATQKAVPGAFTGEAVLTRLRDEAHTRLGSPCAQFRDGEDSAVRRFLKNHSLAVIAARRSTCSMTL